ncbi:CYP27A1 [Symbiodinium sp. CCMP2592]|nr:CYP27A1 [Symbiodinium sp. CCMP2592]
MPRHGARICLGRTLADYEGKLAMVKVLQKFVLEEWTKPRMEEITTFVTVPATDVVIRLRRRGVETQKICGDRMAAPFSHPHPESPIP